MNGKSPIGGGVQTLQLERPAATVWVVEDGQLAEYRRTGDCNGCGDCCKGRIRFQSRTTPGPGHGGPTEETEETAADWEPWEGWAIIQAMGLWWWYKPMGIEKGPDIPDCALLEAGRCSVWKGDDFPAVCRIWPAHPSEMTEFPRCGFKFERA